MLPNQKQVSLKNHHKFSIVLTGGGSGGHIVPLLSIAQDIKKLKPEAELIYIGFKGDGNKSFTANKEEFSKIYLISAGKFRRYYNESFIERLIDIKTLALNFRDLIRVINGFFEARKILSKNTPNIILLKGGFVSLPVGLAAKSLAIPFITHDSDAIEGIANKIVGRWARLNLTGQLSHFYSYKNPRFVGVPVSKKVRWLNMEAKAALKSELKLPQKSLVLLISGGSQGASRINHAIINIARDLLTDQKLLHIVHVCGQKNFDDVKQKYNSKLSDQQKLQLKLIGFSDEFYKWSGVADLIITRAGATSIAEFAAQKKACIVIPSVHLAGGHQLKNAETLERMKAAEIINEPIDEKILLNQTISLLNNAAKREDFSNNIAKLGNKDSSLEISKILVGEAH